LLVSGSLFALPTGTIPGYILKSRIFFDLLNRGSAMTTEERLDKVEQQNPRESA
jgi:hypothetical protein